MRRVLFLIPAALVAGCALVSKMFPPDPPDGFTAAATRLPGAQSLAAGIALEDLLRTQRGEIEAEGGLKPDGGIREGDEDGGAGGIDDGGWRRWDAFAARCLQDPANYEAWVELDPAKHSWKINLLLKGACARGGYGGGGAYEIDVDSLEILHRERFE